MRANAARSGEKRLETDIGREHFEVFQFLTIYYLSSYQITLSDTI
jgi:hypothetical protein